MDLVAAFLGRPSSASDDEGLATKLRELLAVARGAWSGLRVSDQRFVEHLGQHHTPEELQSLSAERAADLYLACAGAEGDEAAVTILETQFLKPALGHLGRVRLSDAQREELGQQLRVHLLIRGQSRLASYTGQGALAAWVRVVAVRLAIDLLRSEASRNVPAGAAAEAEELVTFVDPHVLHVKNRFGAELRGAIVETVGALAVEDRALLKLYYLDGCSIDRLAAIYDVHRSTAARRLERLREHLYAEVRARFLAATGLPANELESLLDLLVSQLEVGLSRLLA